MNDWTRSSSQHDDRRVLTRWSLEWLSYWLLERLKCIGSASRQGKDDQLYRSDTVQSADHRSQTNWSTDSVRWVDVALRSQSRKETTGRSWGENGFCSTRNCSAAWNVRFACCQWDSRSSDRFILTFDNPFHCPIDEIRVPFFFQRKASNRSCSFSILNRNTSRILNAQIGERVSHDVEMLSV